MITRVLRRGMRGDDVAEWQLFLIGQTFDPGTVDGAFGALTVEATIGFQKAHSLDADGVAGRNTINAAVALKLYTNVNPDDWDETDGGRLPG